MVDQAVANLKAVVGVRKRNDSPKIEAYGNINSLAPNVAEDHL